jgi:F1F0 ATPase subunit 2
MNDMLSLGIISWVSGVLLGAIFFGGLWWTVQKVVSSKRSSIWCMAGLFLRMSVALAGFYFVAHGSWERLLLCLLGFFMVRHIVTHLTRRAGKPSYTLQEVSHAPQSR